MLPIALPGEKLLAGVLLADADPGDGRDRGYRDYLKDAIRNVLALCRSIVDAHSGRLGAVPGEPCGTPFQFTLPAGVVTSGRVLW